MNAEALPDTNPKTRYGAQKVQLHLIPPAAMIAEAGVFALGAKKYGPYNWREHAVSATVYQAAALRHLISWFDGEEIDPESGESHLAHARACIGILLDAKATGKLNDDRPLPGAAAELIRQSTKPMHTGGDVGPLATPEYVIPTTIYADFAKNFIECTVTTEPRSTFVGGKGAGEE